MRWFKALVLKAWDGKNYIKFDFKILSNKINLLNPVKKKHQYT